jgi:vancomycin resistance protein YoaR
VAPLKSAVPVRTESTIYRPRVRHSPRRIAVRRFVFLTGVTVVVVTVVGLAFAGSQSTLPAGTTVAGVDVGGLSQDEAVQLLSDRAAAVERSPVSFTAGGRTFPLTASQLGVEADWSAAVAAAAAQGEGFGPLQGYKRLGARVFGNDVQPHLRAYDAAVQYKLNQIAGAIDREGVDARLVRKGLSIEVVDGQSGRKLDRAAAKVVVVHALGSFERGSPVELPLQEIAPSVDAAQLAPAAEKARTALSAPLRLAYGETRWRVPRWRIAPLLALPSGGVTDVSIGGRAAERYLERLSGAVSHKPEDAHFQVAASGKIVVSPSRPGLQLDLAATAKAITAAAFSTDRRTADLVVRVAEPQRTTEVAKTMGIQDVISSYTTTYGGTPGRLNNVQLVAKLIDGTLIKPGGMFSFNGTTGERTAAKGFQEAPVIINGELQNGLGGGICQVSTTVFNAAFEAGLPITARTNHALYIDHYPLGRDATVNYPDLDLRFINDSDHWILLRTFVGSGSLTVNLYGTPLHRRVESTTEPLTVTGPVPVKETDDPALEKGKRVTDEFGAPPRETSVRRLVYDPDGKLLYDNTWRSFYVGEPSLVRVGTKEPAKGKPGKEKAGTGTIPTLTTGTATTPTGTTPAETTPAGTTTTVTTPAAQR